MDLKEMVKYCYNTHLDTGNYETMQRYYNGSHDILSSYRKFQKRSNIIVVCNYIQKLIDDEVSYIISKPLNYVSKSGNTDYVNLIENIMIPWGRRHNQELLKKSSILSKAYELYYIDKYGQFRAQLYDALNSTLLADENGEILIFCYFFNKAFDDKIYIGAYTKDKKYVFDSQYQIIEQSKHYFGEVPVTPLIMDIDDTIYSRIRSKNDALNNILSDGVNTISDFRGSYLKLKGASITAERAELMDSHGIIQLPADAEIDFLVNNINDSHYQNQVMNLTSKIYELSGHVDTNEKLQSNISGATLRGRLFGLENRCSLIADGFLDAVQNRLKFMEIYLNKYDRNLFQKLFGANKYNYKDIVLKYTPNVPQDFNGLCDSISKLKDIVPHQTLMSWLDKIDNPAREWELFKQEQNELLNMVDDDDGE